MNNKKAFGCLPSLIVILAFIVFSICTWGATYYVSTNGNDASNGLTLAGAFRTVGKGYTNATVGDTVLVTVGSYTNERLTLRKSGITFLGSNMPSMGQFYVRTNSNITINGFEMTGPGGIASQDPYIKVTGPSSNINILSNYIHGIQNNVGAIKLRDDTTYTGADSSNIIYAPKNITIRGNVMTDVSNVCVSIWGSNVLFVGNVITNIVNFDAIQTFGQYITIRSNYFANLTRTGSQHVDVFQSFANGQASDQYNNIVFEQNIASNCPGSQIFMIESYNYPNMHTYTFRNNVFYGLGLAGGIYTSNVTIYNNTFYRCTTNTAQPIPFRYSATKGQGAYGVIANNILVECGSDPASATMGFYLADTNITNTLSVYNNFIAGTAGAAKTGFANTNGINSGNILFVDATNGNFQLQATSPAIGVAFVHTNLFTNDLVSYNRGTVWDMGAYEYQTTAVVNRPKQPSKTSIILNRLYHLIGIKRK